MSLQIQNNSRILEWNSYSSEKSEWNDNNYLNRLVHDLFNLTARLAGLGARNLRQHNYLMKSGNYVSYFNPYCILCENDVARSYCKDPVLWYYAHHSHCNDGQDYFSLVSFSTGLFIFLDDVAEF